MNCEQFTTKSARILIGLVLLMLLIALGSYAKLNFEQVKYLDPAPATISVAGEGEVLAVPDLGLFSFSVTTEAPEITVAQEQSATAVNSIIAYLREQGVDEKDIKTVSYNLYPKYRWEEGMCATNLGMYCPPGEQIQDGFEASQTIEVKVRQVNQAGALIAGIGERGANNISGLNFTVDDIEALRDEARAKAITDAQEKAVVLANQLGVRITRMATYVEDGPYAPRPYFEKTMAMDAVAEGVPETPVGEQSTRVAVTVTYEVE